jgi:nucleoside-diphosphate-sugar epimerase
MKVFVTGATGFIGAAIAKELLGAGHQVLGMARSDEGAKALAAAGVWVHRGDLEDLQSLRSGAAESDAVIHCAFVHDFSRFKEVCEIDAHAIETLADALAGSNRPLVVSAGIGPLAPGRNATENDLPPDHPTFPRVSEQVALAMTKRGARVSVVRLPQVHDTVKQGLVTYLVATAREKGVSAYIGDGLNRWPAVHVLDCARLYRLVLERGAVGASYHAVGEEGVPLKGIAQAIGRGLKIPVVSQTPEQGAEHFGWLAYFVGADIPASSAITQKQLGWHPTHRGMLPDLDEMDYSAAR